jgi:hypothetical protein
MIFSAGGGSPITPVEEMNTSFGSQPKIGVPEIGSPAPNERGNTHSSF